MAAACWRVHFQVLQTFFITMCEKVVFLLSFDLGLMDKRTKRLIMICKALHLRDDIDRLYATRKEGGRGFTSIENCINATVRVLKEYSEKCKERLIIASSNSNINRNNLRKNRKTTKIQKAKNGGKTTILTLQGTN